MTTNTPFTSSTDDLSSLQQEMIGAFRVFNSFKGKRIVPLDDQAFIDLTVVDLPEAAQHLQTICETLSETAGQSDMLDDLKEIITNAIDPELVPAS